MFLFARKALAFEYSYVIIKWRPNVGHDLCDGKEWFLIRIHRLLPRNESLNRDICN
jgi:hypothetical protein